MERVALDAEDWADLVARAHGAHPRAGPKDGPYAALLAGRPFVIGQVGQSLDGRIATAAGDATEVSGEDGFLHLHRLRALADAVIVGATTAIRDDPRLTVRHCEGPSPARIVIDPNGRVPNDLRLFGDDGTRRVVVQSVPTARPEGVEIIRLPRLGNGIDPAAIVAALAGRGLRRLLVEGGATTLGHFHAAGALDRLHVTVAPIIIGAGPAGLALPPTERLRDCLRPTVTAYDLGTDILFDCDLHRKPAAVAAE